MARGLLTHVGMRWPALVATCALAIAGPARAEPLAEVAVRLGSGMASGGGAGRSTVRAAPVVATVEGAYAFRDQPYVWGFVGLTLETHDRTGVGLEAGVATAVGRGGRVRVGLRSIARPYTLHGATVGATWCWPSAPLRGCVDLAGDVYVAGTDLPPRTAVAQLILAVGTAFDVL